MKKAIKRIILCSTFLILIFSMPVHAAGVGITLDGYFDDWSDKPEIVLTPGDSGNMKQEHIVKWYTDDNYLYLYIDMSNSNKGKEPSCPIKYYINGVKQDPGILAKKGTGNSVQVYYGDEDENGKVIGNEKAIPNSGGLYGYSEAECEFKIPLSVFENGAKNQMLSIEMEFPNLGKGTIHFEVGSTYPYTGIVICGAVAFFSFTIYTRKKRKTS